MVWDSLFVPALHSLVLGGKHAYSTAASLGLGCCPVRVWFPRVLLSLSGPAGGVSCALRSSVLSTFCYLCGPILYDCGRGGELPHRATIKGHRMEKGGLLAELSSLCRSKWLQLSLSPN